MLPAMTPPSPSAAHEPGPPWTRLRAVDVARGLVMVLMAIDHVRVYSGVPAGGASAGVFLTRWITHFCAPAFVFLAGTGAFLRGRRHADTPRFLLTRGLWLVLLELTVLRFAWTFQLDLGGAYLAGVIWAIGWSMVVLAALVRLPLPVVAAFGLVVIGAHDLVGRHLGEIVPTLGNDARGALWRILYAGFLPGPVRIGDSGPSLLVLYSIVPWVGVMAAGFAFGRLLELERPRRERACFGLGALALALFLTLRTIDGYGDPRPWHALAGRVPAVFAFLSPNKYPASLDFLLMTLGPLLLALPLLERLRGRLGDGLALLGRVPLFYYVAHLFVIHALACGVSWVRTGAVDPWLIAPHPTGAPPVPEGYTWSLGLLYAVWALALVPLVLACRWFAGVKRRRRDWRLSYL